MSRYDLHRPGILAGSTAGFYGLFDSIQPVLFILRRKLCVQLRVAEAPG